MNVIIGLPMLVLHLLLLYKTFFSNPFTMLTLGAEWVSPDRLDNQGVTETKHLKGYFNNVKIIGFVYFSLVMFVVNSCFAHVQVSSRILSTSPMVYWFAAQYIEDRFKASASQIINNSFPKAS